MRSGALTVCSDSLAGARFRARYICVLKDGGHGDDALRDALRATVKQCVAGYKAPSWIEFVADLPRTSTGKIQRFRLRE